MYTPKQKRFLMTSLIVSNILNITVIALTIFHHFTMQDELKRLRNS